MQGRNIDGMGAFLNALEGVKQDDTRLVYTADAAPLSSRGHSAPRASVKANTSFFVQVIVNAAREINSKNTEEKHKTIEFAAKLVMMLRTCIITGRDFAGYDNATLSGGAISNFRAAVERVADKTAKTFMPAAGVDDDIALAAISLVMDNMDVIDSAIENPLVNVLVTITLHMSEESKNVNDNNMLTCKHMSEFGKLFKIASSTLNFNR